jgi:tetraacyldisaccharide 4'-kinase
MIVADALLTEDDVDLPAGQAAPVFRLRRTSGGPCDDRPAFAAAGIASPDRFFDALRAGGWNLAGTRAFRDHHPYSAADAAGLFESARAAGAAVVATTEKDLVRLLPFRPFAMPVVHVPLTVEPEPADEFRRWLAGALRDARDEIDG